MNSTKNSGLCFLPSEDGQWGDCCSDYGVHPKPLWFYLLITLPVEFLLVELKQKDDGTTGARKTRKEMSAFALLTGAALALIIVKMFTQEEGKSCTDYGIWACYQGLVFLFTNSAALVTCLVLWLRLEIKKFYPTLLKIAAFCWPRILLPWNIFRPYMNEYGYWRIDLPNLAKADTKYGPEHLFSATLALLGGGLTHGIPGMAILSPCILILLVSIIAVQALRVDTKLPRSWWTNVACLLGFPVVVGILAVAIPINLLFKLLSVPIYLILTCCEELYNARRRYMDEKMARKTLERRKRIEDMERLEMETMVRIREEEERERIERAERERRERFAEERRESPRMALKKKSVDKSEESDLSDRLQSRLAKMATPVERRRGRKAVSESSGGSGSESELSESDFSDDEDEKEYGDLEAAAPRMALKSSFGSSVLRGAAAPAPAPDEGGLESSLEALRKDELLMRSLPARPLFDDFAPTLPSNLQEPQKMNLMAAGFLDDDDLKEAAEKHEKKKMKMKKETKLRGKKAFDLVLKQLKNLVLFDVLGNVILWGSGLLFIIFTISCNYAILLFAGTSVADIPKMDWDARRTSLLIDCYISNFKEISFSSGMGFLEILLFAVPALLSVVSFARTVLSDRGDD